jgi:UDP-glucose 4-epimerase
MFLMDLRFCFNRTAETAPINVYGQTKLAGEQAIQNGALKQSSYVPLGFIPPTAKILLRPCVV